MNSVIHEAQCRSQTPARRIDVSALCDDIVKSFCLKACVDGEYPVCLYSVTVNMCTVASTGAGSEGRGLEGALT